MTGPDLMAIRSAASALEQVSFYFGGEMGVQLGGHAEFVRTYLVTQNFFSVFGVVPMFGHGFGTSGREGDQQHGAIVSLPFAQRNFGSGAAALGQILHMEGVAYEIVGVVPARFRFPPEAQMWLEVPRISRPWEFLFYVRDFDSSDGYEHPFVAIISEALARQSFPGRDPIGHTVRCGLDSPEWMTVVGVVADVRQDSPASSPGPTLYMPLLQHPFRGNEVEVVMRSAVWPPSLIDPVRSKMRNLNPEVATNFTTMEAMVADSIATPRLRMMLVGLFAGLALLLAMAGMYGVMSYVTAQRIPEFVVRMAMGASPLNLLALVLGRATQMAALGVVIGLGLAFSATRIMNRILFGLKATDAATYAGVLLAVMPIVVLAAAIPAWRAARVDPAVALRNE